MNLYAYVHNDPINAVDSLGLLDAIGAHTFWQGAAENGFSQGGFLGNAQATASVAMMTVLDFFSAPTIQSLAEKSGTASAKPCNHGKAAVLGIAAAVLIVMSAIPGGGKAVSLVESQGVKLLTAETLVLGEKQAMIGLLKEGEVLAISLLRGRSSSQSFFQMNRGNFGYAK